MRKNGTIVRFTTEELAEMRRRGEGQTNLEAVVALTEEELETSIDHDEEGVVDWNTISTELPKPPRKVSFTMRYDPEVLEWFRSQGSGYQTRMNSVLRAYIDAQSKKSA